MERKLRELLPGGKFENVSKVRSKAMGAIRSKGNRTTELPFKMALVRAGMAGWQTSPEDLPGKPDFFYRQSRLAVFVDGCYWHGCPKCMADRIRKTNGAFWTAKILRNQERDAEKQRRLETDGIRVLRFWEHELKDDLGGCVERVQQELNERSSILEWDEDGLRSVYD